MIAMVNQEPEVIIQEVEVVKEIEVIKEVPIKVEVEPTYAYKVTSEEREMLARLVYLEANVESLDCQKAIASTVINRWQNGRWGDSIKDVIYAEGQFSPAYLISSTTPNNTNYEAVDYVLKNGCTLPDYILYFRAAYHFAWHGYQPYTSIDQTYFGYMEKDKK
jgi:spore germination cell wall hydrolase CwlJ-like protein